MGENRREIDDARRLVDRGGLHGCDHVKSGVRVDPLPSTDVANYPHPIALSPLHLVR
jgi:hypothetical protein